MFAAEKHHLILPDMLGANAIRPTAEVLAEVLDSVDVRTDRGLGEVAALQLLNHELSQMGHRKDLHVTHNVHRPPNYSEAITPAAAAPAASF